VQKLHRGNVGRDRAYFKKKEFCARQIQKIVRGKLGRKRFKKVKAESNESKQSIIGSFLSWGTVGSSTKKEKAKSSEPQKKGILGSFGFGKKEVSDNDSVDSKDSKGATMNAAGPVVEKAMKVNVIK
jgi:hypothetical protein